MAIVKKVKIDKFRMFHNEEFELGRNITVIAGRNATQKTTVLGMIGQPFSINKRNNDNIVYKTIDGHSFRSQFSEKFRLSKKYDLIGEHDWTLYIDKHKYPKGYYHMKSMLRSKSSNVLRFWNAEGRSKGSGYIPIPVYFLSLSRLYPIGETKKTTTQRISLTDEEKRYCIKNFREILSIQEVGSGECNIGVEKGPISRTFAGVNDGIHDIFTNSAGEGNIGKIILTVLSYERIKNKYPSRYKGGILLIDEIDATLYGFAQKQIIRYLYKESKRLDLQVVMTSHSPIILNEICTLQKEERKYCDENFKPLETYDNAIVYLEPGYDEEMHRIVKASNIYYPDQLGRILDDLELSFDNNVSPIKIYCEDAEAKYFFEYLIKTYIKSCRAINLYLKTMDVDLGWNNYIQLITKNVPEFTDNLIMLDADVPNMKEYKSIKAKISQIKNIAFLPLEVERGLFLFYRDKENLRNLLNNYRYISMDYCFNKWPLSPSEYKTKDFKEWFKHMTDKISREDMFDIWCSRNYDIVSKFIEDVIQKFNTIAESKNIETIPLDYKLK